MGKRNSNTRLPFKNTSSHWVSSNLRAWRLQAVRFFKSFHNFFPIRWKYMRIFFFLWYYFFLKTQVYLFGRMYFIRENILNMFLQKDDFSVLLYDKKKFQNYWFIFQKDFVFLILQFLLWWNRLFFSNRRDLFQHRL